MTPHQPNKQAFRMNRAIMVGGALLLLAGSVAAQLPVDPSVALDPVSTPVGTTDLSYMGGNLDACSDLAAGTDMVPAAPVDLPETPVALPDASAAADACAHADLNNLEADADLGATATNSAANLAVDGSAMASEAGLDAQVDAEAESEGITAKLSAMVKVVFGFFGF